MEVRGKVAQHKIVPKKFPSLKCLVQFFYCFIANMDHFLFSEIFFSFFFKSKTALLPPIKQKTGSVHAVTLATCSVTTSHRRTRVSFTISNQSN